MIRHFAWFHATAGHWIGEWRGRVPAPALPAGVIGEARLALLNAWQQKIQRAISPDGSPYAADAQAWNLDAWDNCAAGAAVCLDVTIYLWPVGDFQWARFDGVDRVLAFPEARDYLQIAANTLQLDVNSRSGRPIRSTAQKAVIDITGSPLAALHGRLFGRLIKRDGVIRVEGLELPIQGALEAHGGDLLRREGYRLNEADRVR